jgi:hypothetical protein
MPGAVGALLRREGLYSLHLVVWRRARGRSELAALATKQRGRKPTPVDPRDRKNHRVRAAAGRDRASRAGRGADRPAWGACAVMTALVEERRAQIGIGPVCEALGLARPAFYRRRGAARRGTGGPRVSGGRPGSRIARLS